MIYQRLKAINEDVYHRGPGYHQNLTARINQMNYNISDSEYFNWPIRIPRDYARMESDRKVKPDEVEAVDHYKIFITKQIGTPRNRRDCFLYCQFPNSARLYKIILHMDGGISYEKSEHRYMIRETDELDRRIVLGFCKLYQGNMLSLCYSDNPNPDKWMLNNGASYRCNMVAKRIKQGSENNYYPYKDLKPYEEHHHTIFTNLALI